MKRTIRGAIAVQYKDIMFLMAINETLPSTVIQKIAEVKNAREDDYISFDNNEEIEYFNRLDFILKYSDYAYLSIADIKTEIQKTKDSIALTVERYGQMIKYDKLRSNMILNDYEKLKYKLSNLSIMCTEKETDVVTSKNIVKEKLPQKTKPFWKR